MWKKTKTITGSPAEGSVYLKRLYINDEFWHRIECGEHILFTAPRRVGKSSVMKDLEKDCPKGFVVVYQNIESDSSQNELFKRLLTLILDKLKTHQKITGKISLWMKERSIGEVSADGTVKFIRKEINYKDELLHLIEELGKEKVKFIFLLDEFPDDIQSIFRTEGEDKAIETLHTLRSIRHDAKFKGFSFVFAGSVGLEHVVASLDRPKLINDLTPIHIDQLTEAEALELINMLVSEASMEVGVEEKNYLVQKVSYLLPYYVQLMIEKCDFILQRQNRPTLNNRDIDDAFQLVISEGRNFPDWEDRLKKYFSKEDSAFCIGLLTRCAHYNAYSIQEAYNFSMGFSSQIRYKHLLDEVLVKDGYLVLENNSYRFLSPFLKEWWKARHPEFEING